MSELADRKTPLTADEAAKAIAAGYRAVVGSTPSQKILALLIGQWALETGNGQSIHNFNFGNVKFSSSRDTDWQFFRCWELVGGEKVYYDPPSNVCKFAAYRTPEDGARAFIETLKRRPHWWAGLQTGTPEGFVKGLTTAPAYFTDNPATYMKNLVNRSEAFMQYAKKYGASATANFISALIVAGGVYYTYRKVQPEIAVMTGRFNSRIRRGFAR